MGQFREYLKNKIKEKNMKKLGFNKEMLNELLKGDDNNLEVIVNRVVKTIEERINEM